MTTPAVTATALAELLTYARQHVPYYQSLIPPGPIEAGEAPEVLLQLPLLTRDDVRSQRPRLWSAVGDARTWRTVRTTGTTGTPLELVVDERAQQAELESLARHVESRIEGWRDSDILHLTLHQASTSRAAASPWSTKARLAKWNLSRAWQLPDAEFVSSVRHLHGHIITSMPFVMATLCDRLESSAAIRPRLVILSGEQSTPDLRQRIRRTFRCPVTTLYTLAEAGIAASQCGTADTYHVNTTDALLEIVDENGAPSPAGIPGDIVVTPLVNRALPMLRYVTGDKGAWTRGRCRCSSLGRRFRLLEGRTEHRLVTGPIGRDVSRIDVAKLFIQLDLDVHRIVRSGNEVVVEHRDEKPATDTQRTVTGAALRGLLGAGTTVRLRQVVGKPAQAADATPLTSAPPSFATPAEIAAWARDRLADERAIRAAVLSGSFLDAAAVSRFSDIDMTLVIDEDPYQPYWRDLATSMNRHIAMLRVNITEVSGVMRSPLVACRLLAERLPVIGQLERTGVDWPSRSELAGEARFWAQNAENVIWTRLTAAERTRNDPLRDAWLASRYALDALRYHFLLEGGRTTAARHVLQAATERGIPHAQEIRAAFEVAREHRPPPEAGSGGADQFLADALSCVHWVSAPL